MSTTAVAMPGVAAPYAAAGARIAGARRSADLTQRELGERIGLPLGTVERLEQGRVDPARYLDAIAVVTGWEARLLAPRPGAGEGEPALSPTADELSGDARRVSLRRLATDASVSVTRATPGQVIVLGTLITLVLIRFFTEIIHVLPRAATFIDVPLFVLLVVAALGRPRDASAGRAHGAFAVAAVLFGAVIVMSTLANLDRIAPVPVLAFVYGFLGPIGVYYAVYRLWPPGHARSLSRLLVVLGVVQLMVVVGFGLPRFLATGNPDVVSGTFGDNAYQLVVFLLVVTALLAGIMVFESHRLAARLAPFMFVGIAATIFLAQYRALLVTTIVTVIVIGAFLSVARGSGVVIAAVLLAAFISTLAYVSSRFPETKFTATIETLQQDPLFFASVRLDALDDVFQLYADDARFVVTGSGPATYSSRAWRTFAIIDDDSRTAVAAPFATRLAGGYRTDVSEKYVRPRLGEVIQGSHAVTNPYSSYSALMAEVGVLGFFLLIGTYFAALLRAARLTVTTMRERIPRDPLPALFLAATVAFILLLQLGALDNWLEVSRLTFITWALLAVATKEFDARRKGAGT